MGNLEIEINNTDGSMSDILKSVLTTKNLSQRRFAEMTGQTPQNFNQKLKRNTIRADEFKEWMKQLGYEIKITDAKSKMEFQPIIKGHGRRIKQMINGVLYDTYKANAICSNFFHDGMNEYTDGMAFELYVDSNGRYFVARYTEWDNGTDSITTISEKEANKLNKKYGNGSTLESKIS